MKYTNPVLPGFYPDPSLCRVGADYYLAASSFEYFPGVPIFHSRDLVHWKQIGHCLTRKSQLNLDTVPSSCGIFAPTLRYNNRRFYMITSNIAGGGHFFVYTDDIRGEWSEPVWVDGNGNGSGHDPDLFFDDDGKVYYSRFSWENGILQWEIDLPTGRLSNGPVSIWKGFEDRYCEAPHLYKINGLYYLLVAEGGTARGHMIVIARSSTPRGPFTGCPHNPILSHRSHVLEPIQATGHGDLIQAEDGTWWIVFLGIRALNSGGVHNLGRETYLAPVTWDHDGWPVINGGNPIRMDMDVEHLLPSHCWEPEEVRDDFDKDSLGLSWNFRFNPSEGSWSLVERRDWLALRGLPATLSGLQNLSFIGRRQSHFDFAATALMDFTPGRDGEEAGLCAIMNETHHYEIAVCRTKGESKIIVRRRIGDLDAIVYENAVADGAIRLSIQGDRNTYHFGFGLKEKPIRYIAKGDARYLSTEVGGGFTGVYLGMYATGNGEQARTSAYFDWFEYVPAVSETSTL